MHRTGREAVFSGDGAIPDNAADPPNAPARPWRVRAIPSRAPPGRGSAWADVEQRLAQFPPWTGEVLAIDAVQPLAQNLATVLEYVTD